METNGLVYRLSFFAVSCLAAIVYESFVFTLPLAQALLIGSVKGATIFSVILLLDLLIKRLTLRNFNTLLIGIGLGTLMGYSLVYCMHTFFSLLHAGIQSEIRVFCTMLGYIASLYFSVHVTFTAAEVWWLSIPFVQLSPAGQAKKKEILLDISALEDSRLTDLVRLGILDHQLVIASFVLKEIQKGLEAQDENVKTRYRKCFEQLKRLENIPTLGLQHKEFHTSELDDLQTKLLRTAKLVGAHILTSDHQNFKLGEEEGIIIISLEAIANAIKPSAQRGEVLQIKIQRLGKEPKQGVGYLEDGTMVVVNGGGEFLGETIKTQVLSQKYSSSGKIIFCNALNAEEKNNLRYGLGTQDEPNFNHSHYTAPMLERREESYVPVPRIKKESHERSTDSWNRH